MSFKDEQYFTDKPNGLSGTPESDALYEILATGFHHFFGDDVESEVSVDFMETMAESIQAQIYTEVLELVNNAAVHVDLNAENMDAVIDTVDKLKADIRAKAETKWGTK